MKNLRSQRACVWSAVAFMALFGAGLVCARFIVPPHPSESAAQVAAKFADHANAIRFGMILSLFSLAFYVPWTAAISVQLKRIEGQYSPFAYAQLALGAGFPVAFLPALYFWCVAAYRPDRSPESILTLNDMGWLPFTGTIFLAFLQNVVIGLAVLSDLRTSPILPRWFGYLSIWAGILYCPACLDIFFKDGVLAWNGLLTWWLSLSAFAVWLAAAVTVMFRAISNQASEPDVLAPGDRVLTSPEPVGLFAE